MLHKNIERIDFIFAEIKSTLVALYAAKLALATAKNRFDSAYQVGLAEQQFTGRNEDERMGNMRIIYPALALQLQEARIFEMECERNYKLAVLEYEHFMIVNGIQEETIKLRQPLQR